MNPRLLCFHRWPAVRSCASAGSASPFRCPHACRAPESGLACRPGVITDEQDDGPQALQARAQATSDGAAAPLSP